MSLMAAGRGRAAPATRGPFLDLLSTPEARGRAQRALFVEGREEGQRGLGLVGGGQGPREARTRGSAACMSHLPVWAAGGAPPGWASGPIGFPSHLGGGCWSPF